MHAAFLFPVVLAALSASSCGSGLPGDCSGGAPVDGTCQSTQPTVRWTADRASAAVDRLGYAPMVPGRLSEASCRITARSAGDEAEAVCDATFTAPGRAAARRIRVAFDLGGTGVVNVRCPAEAAKNPFCRWNRSHT